MKKKLNRILPPDIKRKLSRSEFWIRYSAQKLAASSKRLDLCAAQFAHGFHLAGIQSLEGKVCLEVGSGWVLTHALVCTLLGARRVIATDIDPLAIPGVLPLAIERANTALIRDLLAPFSTHQAVRERLEHLRNIRTFSFKVLNDLGIEYLSPVDLAKNKPDAAIDFVYSLSVLEHVPQDDVSKLLTNLSESLAPGGQMLHYIHLEDHQDFDKYPFDFLSIPENAYPRELQSERGNRLRLSQWEKTFEQLPGIRNRIIYRYSRLTPPLPAEIDRSVLYTDKEDLRISHIGVYSQK
ncbi:MAG: class I SAM-dependent methyltransferase [Anaerolineales bacterium]|nr:class I SAM-dependent methyltransferase [Anaerolineales bacterium]